MTTTITAQEATFFINNTISSSTILFLLADSEDKHYNGFYTWTLGTYSDIVKIITVPGGDLGEVEYISSNENREAEVFYRPEF